MSHPEHKDAPRANAAEGEAADRQQARNTALSLAVILTTVTLVVLDGAIANIALPSITVAFGVSAGEAVWIVTMYQLGVVVALLPCAALGESIGGRKVYLAGVLIFTLASAACAAAPNMSMLVFARFVQGLGGGAIMGLGAMMIRFTFRPEVLAHALGWNAMAVALSSAAGPAIGAMILSVADWPWLFIVNIPIGAFVLLGSRNLPRPVGSGRRLDGVSAGFNTGFFVLLVLGADIAATRGLAGTAMLAGAATCLAAVILRERRVEAPLIPIDLFRNGSFRYSVAASISCFSGQTMGYLAIPFLIQHQMGLSIFTAGSVMMVWPLLVAVTAPISARLSKRMPTGLICAAGGSLLGVGLAIGGAWPLYGGLAPLVSGIALCGIGFGLFQTANNQVLLLSAPKKRSGAAGGMQGTARLMGQTIGALAMSLLFDHAPDGKALQIGLIIAAVFALCAAAISSIRLQHDRRAAQEPST
ncbi:MAG: MFS transporter [Alphaproteobacteria bacterium]|nr:MFS transporter [Alphaproteobacteria bacterium]